jgi:S-adenosylmethionine:tRNA ribosyltransferase-isomerase
VRPGAGSQDLGVLDLPDLLEPGDVMVFNDTRTIPAALTGERAPRRPGDPPARIDINLHHRDGPDLWRAFARPAKRLRAGDTMRFGADAGLSATVEALAGGGEVAIRFDRAGAALDAAVAVAGLMPLPPYIARKRAIDAADAADYQTIYAAQDGSVATPTAGLHFTERLLDALDARGVVRCFVTLHVGAGTFLPVKSERVEEHRMHAEWCCLPEDAADTLNAARADGRRIVAVGTTALRTLETAVDPTGRFRPFLGETDIFITPGRPVRSVDALMTNFHLPKSTLIMLVAALSGLETTRTAYAHAIDQGYRFYSYGDAGLWFRELA